jgi:hypothetical protein
MLRWGLANGGFGANVDVLAEVCPHMNAWFTDDETKPSTEGEYHCGEKRQYWEHLKLSFFQLDRSSFGPTASMETDFN